MFNSNYKRYNFYEFLSAMFAMVCMCQVGRFDVTNDKITALVGAVYFLLSIIFAIYGAKYFNKTYQLKKNAKKEFTKENKNK